MTLSVTLSLTLISDTNPANHKKCALRGWEQQTGDWKLVFDDLGNAAWPRYVSTCRGNVRINDSVTHLCWPRHPRTWRMLILADLCTWAFGPQWNLDLHAQSTIQKKHRKLITVFAYLEWRDRVLRCPARRDVCPETVCPLDWHSGQ